MKYACNLVLKRLLNFVLGMCAITALTMSLDAQASARFGQLANLLQARFATTIARQPLGESTVRSRLASHMGTRAQSEIESGDIKFLGRAMQPPRQPTAREKIQSLLSADAKRLPIRTDEQEVLETLQRSAENNPTYMTNAYLRGFQRAYPRIREQAQQVVRNTQIRNEQDALLRAMQRERGPLGFGSHEGFDF